MQWSTQVWKRMVIRMGSLAPFKDLSTETDRALLCVKVNDIAKELWLFGVFVLEVLQEPVPGREGLPPRTAVLHGVVTFALPGAIRTLAFRLVFRDTAVPNVPGIASPTFLFRFPRRRRRGGQVHKDRIDGSQQLLVAGRLAQDARGVRLSLHKLLQLTKTLVVDGIVAAGKVGDRLAPILRIQVQFLQTDGTLGLGLVDHTELLPRDRTRSDLLYGGGGGRGRNGTFSLLGIRGRLPVVPIQSRRDILLVVVILGGLEVVVVERDLGSLPGKQGAPGSGTRGAWRGDIPQGSTGGGGAGGWNRLLNRHHNPDSGSRLFQVQLLLGFGAVEPGRDGVTSEGVQGRLKNFFGHRGDVCL